jgi:hypothetical protein
MRKNSRWQCRIWCNSLIGAAVILWVAMTNAQEPANQRLSDAGLEWPPVIGAWFWNDATLRPEGYKEFLDAAATRSPYTLLSSSLRTPKGEVTDRAIHDQIERAVGYARSLGLKVAFDLDVRLARRAFQKRYPDELQEELVLKMVEIPTSGTAQVTFEGTDLTDHMTGGTVPYLCLTSHLVRVYSLVQEAGKVDPKSVRDITSESVQAVADGPRKLMVTVRSQAKGFACVIASHTYLTPDVFAPHLLSFQRDIIQQYADVPLGGALKDEWGFPPDHSGNPRHDRYWYSPAMAGTYAKRSGGRDLVRDAMLMFIAETGRDQERQAAINLYTRLCCERNAEIEEDYYHAGKAAFGPGAFVGTHATWTPYPGSQEFRKNGLDWWEATRDIGQSDETAPFPCRTSLAKRWGFPVCYNQYYSAKTNDYTREFWASALAGGRLNVHPFYPRTDISLGDGHIPLMVQKFMIGISRLRMLDFITRAPLDCPVAVIFGHACAMNWAGPSWNTVGLEIASSLSAKGYPTDLMPSSLAGASVLRVDSEGYVCLGPQRYRAVVLYQPEFGNQQELAFFQEAARGKTAMFMVGSWTKDSECRPLEGTALLGEKVRQCTNVVGCTEQVLQLLNEAGVVRVTGWSEQVKSWGLDKDIPHSAPPRQGYAALTDGTYIRIAGATNSAGDPIQETLSWQGHSVTVDAIGVFAIRFAEDGKVATFAASDLKTLKTDGLEIAMPERADVAFIRETDGQARGVIQGLSGEVPASLLGLTPNWRRMPEPEWRTKLESN